MRRTAALAVWLAVVTVTLSPLSAAPVVAARGFAAEWENHTLNRVTVGGQALPGVNARLQLLDPRSGQPADASRFKLSSRLVARQGALWVEGEVTATGTEETVADLVLRWEGVSLPLSDDGSEPLLLARKLLNKLPLASLRCRATGEDRLGLALPADLPLVFELRDLPTEQAVHLRLPLGFSPQAPAALRMKAPFSILLMATDPRWGFRSVLAEYYRLFPAWFKRITTRSGGWFFANETQNIPNPQHFAFHEGQGDLALDHARGLGMYPYNETGSETIQLPGPDLPRDYADAIRQMEELEKQIVPAAWKFNGGLLDETVKRGGKYSYQASSVLKNQTRSASQFFNPAKPLAGPLVVSGWSKAEGVVSHSGVPNDYSIYVDALMADGRWLFGQCATFKAGTHDWQESRWVIKPPAPLIEIRLYAMFRNHQGTVWFDDFRLVAEDKPEENLLPNGDFETLGQRHDIQFVRDNAMTDEQGRYRVLITDNWGSDVRPTVPLSLLRFVCNVDPDLKAPEGRPTPASRGYQFFDMLFKANPGIDGAYIDGAGAWSCWYLNHRPDHFATVSYPLTYEPKSFQVAQHGRQAGYKWLRYLQQQLQPQGKTIIGNMGPTMEAWPSYTALDIIGIESSHFKDTPLMGYHRFGGYQKPVLPMNFINLHKLDDRDTAEEFVLASAQWGHFPSTGRMVREGYESYGDVCHSYYPALVEMEQVGWEPEPLATGVAAERFGSGDVLYFTVRAPQDGRQATLTVTPYALRAIRQPVVWDAVQLAPVASRLTPAGLTIELQDGARELTVLRVSTAAQARHWLLQRAALHCEYGSRVLAPAPHTEPLQALAKELRALKPEGDTRVKQALEKLGELQKQAAVMPDNLERLSLQRELADVENALAEWLLLTAGGEVGISGRRVVPVSEATTVAAQTQEGQSRVRLLALWPGEERNILRPVGRPIPRIATREALELRRELPGARAVTAAWSLPVSGGPRLTIYRSANVHFTPVANCRVQRVGGSPAEMATYKVTIERLAGPLALTVRGEGPGLTLDPAELTLGPNDTEATFNVKLQGTSAEIRNLVFKVFSEGRLLAHAEAEVRNLPAPPAGDLALASRGATVTSDSSYSGYDPAVTIDGVWETSGLHWTKKAWASADRAIEGGHWLEIKLPQPAPISLIWIYWAIDNSNVFSSRDYNVQVWQEGAWRTVVEARQAPLNTVAQHTWPVTTTDRVRINQLPGGGPASRPHIMWVAEVGLFNLGTLN
jgi:hypothetical protein